MVKQKAAARTFHCEGVILEFENHEEYAIPFFFFSDEDLKILQPGWEKWLEYANDQEQQERESLYLQSQAMEYKRNQQASQKMGHDAVGVVGGRVGRYRFVGSLS